MKQIITGDSLEVLKTIPDQSINCIVTSPPYYGLRDYGVDGQIGLEETPEEFIQKLVDVFHEAKRCLTDDGTLWLNIGDSYCGTGSKGDYKDPKYSEGRNGQRTAVNNRVQGCKQKDLIGIPWMLAFALRSDGWYLRQDIIWHKPNPMPESVKDRCTKSHEYIFLLTKRPNYYFDYEAIQEPVEASSIKRLSQDIDNQIGSFTPSKGNGNMKATCSIRFGGNKYGDNDDPHFATKSGKEWTPQYKNLQEKGQTNHSMHERRAEGLPDEAYYVRNKRDVWHSNNSKYVSIEHESSVRQGMNKDRGYNIIAIRKNLPSKEQLVSLLKRNTCIQQLAEETDIPKTKIEHWFRNDESGFSYPSVDDWNKVRQYVDDGSDEFKTIDYKISDVTIETDEIGKNSHTDDMIYVRNKRDVWSISTKGFKEAHFATFPEDLVEPCILAGCPENGTVLDPFCGSGTTGIVSVRNKRNFIGIELNPEYAEMSDRRITKEESYGIQESMF